MAAKACINWIEPEASTSVRVGDTVNCRIAMYNCGDADGNFYVAIDDDVCGDFNIWLERYVEHICSGSFVMPNRIVTLKFRGGHSEGGFGWTHDFSKTITLTPHGYCEQRFRVVDESGVNIDTATVSVEYDHCTTIHGYCMVSDLEVGRTYRAIASKAGYDCLNCSKTFTACTSRITLSLKKKITTCNQSFIVKDTSGSTITKNCIIVIREGGAWKNECATSTSGTCTVGLIKGTYLRACIEQIPSGYELTTDSCKNFTACTSRITLKLQKTCTCGDWIKGECVSTTHRRYTRTCTPSGCDTETEDRPDSTCAAPPTCPEYTNEPECIAAGCYWYDGTCHEYAPVQCSDYTDALTCEANLCHWWSDGTCHDIPEDIPDYTDTIISWEEWELEPAVNEEVTFAVRLMTDELISLGINGAPINFYANDVLLNEEPIITSDKPGLVGWNGYAEIKYAFTEAGLYDVKAVFPGVEDFNPSESEEKTITVSGAEPTLGKIESITCTATKEAEEKFEITSTVTVKNIDTEVHEYYIRMYDGATDNHLDDEPDTGGVHIEPGETSDIELTTYGKPVAATTPSIKFDLWETTWLDEPVESQTIACTETNLGEIISVSCIATQEAENEYEIEAIVKFKNPDTISHLYKVELLDAETGKSKDHEPNIYESGKEVAPGATTTIVVNTIGGLNCISPKVIIKLWETTGFKALVDEQEIDCSEAGPTMFASLISFLMDSLNISESQAKLMVYGVGGILALSFIMPMLRR